MRRGSINRPCLLLFPRQGSSAIACALRFDAHPGRLPRISADGDDSRLLSAAAKQRFVGWYTGVIAASCSCRQISWNFAPANDCGERLLPEEGGSFPGDRVFESLSLRQGVCHRSEPRDCRRKDPGPIAGSPNSRLGPGLLHTDRRRQTKTARQAVQIVAAAHRLHSNG